ncbi:MULTISPECIES: acyl carrier protein [unclassified Mycobacteroides]|uniref:acyl carrier protein n=1 Tax=unclassified Mycobacteroides TaxID=2618759 RepID=UPI001326D413|nr:MULTISPECIES: acyl carrier protein [unclassified Mycobacteroides]MUM20056.1 hypothetical protein [Mycobacteroides sp. CBMA 326]
MSDVTRERVLGALCEVLYISESELFDGDATDLRDLGLDSVRFMLLMKQLGVGRGSVMQKDMAGDLSVAGWVRVLGQAGLDGAA